MRRLRVLSMAALAVLAIVAVGCGGDNNNGSESGGGRSEEHTSELQSHGPISYAVFCVPWTRFVASVTDVAAIFALPPESFTACLS